MEENVENFDSKSIITCLSEQVIHTLCSDTQVLNKIKRIKIEKFDLNSQTIKSDNYHRRKININSFCIGSYRDEVKINELLSSIILKQTEELERQKKENFEKVKLRFQV